MSDAYESFEIAGEGLSAEISSFGAELVRLRDGEGRDLLWDGDPRFWTGRAPLLFPIVGAVRDNSYRLGETRYTLTKHGFGRSSSFRLIEHTENVVLLRLESSEQSLAAYPFRFRLDMRFEATGSELEMAATVTNMGDAAMPCSFGFHPALRWPLPFGEPRAAHGIRFEAPEPAPIRRLDADGLIAAEARPTPVAGDFLRLEDSLFQEDAIIFDTLSSRRLTYGASKGPSIEVEFPDMPHLGIWTKPGAGFVCIEPWQGFADPASFGGDFRDKPGIVEIAPQASATFSMRLRLVG